MWEASIIDTRKMGDAAFLLDGFVHIVPRRAVELHYISTQCWCDPRVMWPEGGETIIVSHRHLKPPMDGR
jgi:hypothetical protein